MTMKKIQIHIIAAARPNFMKIAPLYHELAKHDWCDVSVVHTGQHYDVSMSDAFFNDLGLPTPDYHLNIGSGSHAEQTAGVMLGYEKVCAKHRPDLTVVVGDVNSTMACAITAVKLGIKVAHLEAGLRSHDRAMPEEINRIITDSISDVLWTPSKDGNEHLHKEGVEAEKITLVGNIMIDSYELQKESIIKCNILKDLSLDLTSKKYGVVTLHRPSNVDNNDIISNIVSQLIAASKKLPIVFAIHPRTEKQLKLFDLYEKISECKTIKLIKPLGYIEFISLVSSAKLIVTDSGGIQEETTYLNIPCLTLRDNTERPITVIQGTNKLIKSDELLDSIDNVLSGSWKNAKKIEYWDGDTAKRVAMDIKTRFVE